MRGVCHETAGVWPPCLAGAHAGEQSLCCVQSHRNMHGLCHDAALFGRDGPAATPLLTPRREDGDRTQNFFSLVRTPASISISHPVTMICNFSSLFRSRSISCVDCRSSFLAATAQHRAFLSMRTVTVRPLSKEDDDSIGDLAGGGSSLVPLMRPCAPSSSPGAQAFTLGDAHLAGGGGDAAGSAAGHCQGEAGLLQQRLDLRPGWGMHVSRANARMLYRHWGALVGRHVCAPAPPACGLLMDANAPCHAMTMICNVSSLSPLLPYFPSS